MSDLPVQRFMARVVESYVHLGRIGVLVELETTDELSARTDEFRELARDLAVHIAARAPVGIERIVLSDLVSWLPPAEEAVGGDEEVLLEQRFVREERITVAERIHETERSLGVAVRVRRFVRFDAAE